MVEFFRKASAPSNALQAFSVTFGTEPCRAQGIKPVSCRSLPVDVNGRRLAMDMAIEIPQDEGCLEEQVWQGKTSLGDCHATCATTEHQ